MEPTTAYTIATTVATEAVKIATETDVSTFDFSGMRPIEIVGTVLLLLAGLALRTWVQLNKSKMAKEDTDRLLNISHIAVGAAEEMGHREQWTSAQKLKYADEFVASAFPKLSKEAREGAVHGALSIIQVGNAGASDYRMTGPK